MHEFNIRDGAEDHSVSVIIPSYGRINLVLEAVKSAAAQTLSPLEIIVVNDGPDENKAKILHELNEPRLRFIEAPFRQSAAATRNFGIQHADGKLIALLDDDDYWFPEKLERQIAAYRSQGAGILIVAGVEEVISAGEIVRCRPSQNLGRKKVENTLFRRGSGVHTSTLLAPKSLFLKITFNEAIKRHEDWEWLLHAGQYADLFTVEDIVCRRVLQSGEGLTRPGNFKFTKNWYIRNCELMSAVTRGYCTAGVLSRKAAYDQDVSALPWLIVEYIRNTPWRVTGYIRLLAPWLLMLISRIRFGRKYSMIRKEF